MHELSITEHLLADCIRNAEAQNALAGTEDRLAALEAQAFHVYIRDGEGARIEAEFPPVRVRCRDCRKEGEITPHHLACPHCGSLRLKLLSGKEFYIKSMEVDINGDQNTASGNGLE